MFKKYENKILLVDDDPKNLQVAMSILKDYNVIYAQNGAKALELLENYSKELIKNVESFDIEKVDYLMNTYLELIENLKVKLGN